MSDSKPTIFAAILVLCLVIGVGAIHLSAPVQAAMVCAWLTAAVLASAWFLRPRGGKIRVQLAALALAGVLAGLALERGWPQIVVQVLNAALDTHFELVAEDPVLPYALLAYGLLLCAMAFHFTKDAPVAGQAGDAGVSALNSADYRDMLARVSARMRERLDQVDRQLSWDDQYLVDIDAEVEEEHKGSKKRSFSRLERSLRRAPPASLFLVLGEPGSGKSVSLRRIARLALAEAPNCGRLPIYFNLREWVDDRSWSNRNAPEVSEIVEHLWLSVQKDLQEQVGDAQDAFFTEYFASMKKHGRFFFIFDSFDEIPAVIDQAAMPRSTVPAEPAPEHLLIERISQALRAVCQGEGAERAVLASRMSRPPSFFHIRPSHVLNLRPLRDRQVAELYISRLDRAAQARPTLLSRLLRTQASWALLREHSWLCTLSRNPLEVSLFAEWLTAHWNGNRTLKQRPNRRDAYQHCLNHRVAQCEADLLARSAVASDLHALLKTFARLLFDGGHGFEIARARLPKALADSMSDDVVDVLCNRRILRKGEGEDSRVSFTHRRFAEYFAALTISRLEVDHFLQDVARDRRWRDALVLYTEIAADDEARHVIDVVWEQLTPLFEHPEQFANRELLPPMQALRFLVEALRFRVELLGERLGPWGELLLRICEHNRDPVVASVAVEGAALLRGQPLGQLLALALGRSEEMIRYSAFDATRHIETPNRELLLQLNEFLYSRSYIELLDGKTSIGFTLHLVPALARTRARYWSLIADPLAWFAGLAVLLVSPPSESSLFVVGVMGSAFTSQRLMLVNAPMLPQWRSMNYKVMNFARVVTAMLAAAILWKSPGAYSLLCWAGVVLVLPFIPIALRVRDVLPAVGVLTGIVAGTGLVVSVMALVLVPLLEWASKTAAWLLGPSAFAVIKMVVIGLTTIWFAIWIAQVGFTLVRAAWTAAVSQVGMIRGWRRWRRNLAEDKRHLKELESGAAPHRTRDWIATELCRLKTTEARALFVRYLEGSGEVTGDWPGLPPYITVEVWGESLARLERRWLGIDS